MAGLRKTSYMASPLLCSKIPHLMLGILSLAFNFHKGCFFIKIFLIFFRWRVADLNDVCVCRLLSDAGQVSGEFRCSSRGLPLQIWRRRVHLGSGRRLHFQWRGAFFRRELCLWFGAKYAKEVGIVCYFEFLNPVVICAFLVTLKGCKWYLRWHFQCYGNLFHGSTDCCELQKQYPPGGRNGMLPQKMFFNTELKRRIVFWGFWPQNCRYLCLLFAICMIK